MIRTLPHVFCVERGKALKQSGASPTPPTNTPGAHIQSQASSVCSGAGGSAENESLRMWRREWVWMVRSSYAGARDRYLKVTFPTCTLFPPFSLLLLLTGRVEPQSPQSPQSPVTASHLLSSSSWLLLIPLPSHPTLTLNTASYSYTCHASH